jgi:hypothetical protein
MAAAQRRRADRWARCGERERLTGGSLMSAISELKFTLEENSSKQIARY